MNAFFWANVPCATDGNGLKCQYPAFLMFAIAMLEELGGGSLALPLKRELLPPSGELIRLPASVQVVPMPFYVGEAEVVHQVRRLAAAVWRRRSLIRRSDIVMAVAPGVVGNLILETALMARRPAVGVVRGSKRRSLDAIYPSGRSRLGYRIAAQAMDLEFALQRRRGVRVIGFGDAIAREYGGAAGVAVHPLVANVFYEMASERRDEAVDAVYVGRLSREKGPWVLLEALTFARRQDRNIRVRFIGDGPDLSALRARAEADNLDVTFAGHVPWGPALVEEMRRARVMVMPSLTEGSPTALAEAMAVGLPAVVSAVGGVPGMTGDPPAARLVAPGDAGQLATAILACLDDPGIRDALIQRGQSRAAGYSIRGEAKRVALILSRWRESR